MAAVLSLAVTGCADSGDEPGIAPTDDTRLPTTGSESASRDGGATGSSVPAATTGGAASSSGASTAGGSSSPANTGMAASSSAGGSGASGASGQSGAAGSTSTTDSDDVSDPMDDMPGAMDDAGEAAAEDPFAGLFGEDGLFGGPAPSEDTGFMPPPESEGGWTLNPDSAAECPAEPPPIPIIGGACLGIYYACGWTNPDGWVYSCICDWVHWLCI